MAIELHHLHPGHDDEVARLKARVSELETLNHDLCERVTENDDIRLHWEEIEQTRADNERMKARIAELERMDTEHTLQIAKMNGYISHLEEERRWRNVDDKFPTADDGYILVLWEDGLPDIGYIGGEDDVIETVRDRGEGHSVEWWLPLPSDPKEGK